MPGILVRRHTRRTPSPPQLDESDIEILNNKGSTGSPGAPGSPDDTDNPDESSSEHNSDDDTTDDGMLTVYNFQGEFFLSQADGYRKEVCKHVRIAKEIFTRMGRTVYACCFEDDPECKCGHWEQAEAVQARRKQGIGLNVTGKHRYPRGKGPQYDVTDILVEDPVQVAREDIAKGKRSVKEAAELSAKLDRQLRAAQKKRQSEQKKKKANANRSGSNRGGKGGCGGGGGGSSGPRKPGKPGTPGTPAPHQAGSDDEDQTDTPPRKSRRPNVRFESPKLDTSTKGKGKGRDEGGGSSNTNSNGKRDRRTQESDEEEDPDAMFRPKKKPISKHPADILKEALERLARPGLRYSVKLEFAETLFSDARIFSSHLRQEGEGLVKLAQNMEQAAEKMRETAKFLAGSKGKEPELEEDPNGDPDRDIQEVLKDAINILTRHDVTTDAKLNFAIKLFGNDRIFNATLRSIASNMLENAGRTHRVLHDNAYNAEERDIHENFD